MMRTLALIGWWRRRVESCRRTIRAASGSATRRACRRSVEEQRTAFSLFEAAMACGVAPVKAPFSWPNSSDSAASFGIAAVLMATKGLSAARGLTVQRVQRQFFAGAGFAVDEHGGVGRRETFLWHEHFLHRGRMAKDVGCGLRIFGVVFLRWLCSSARRISSTAWFTSKGLGRYSNAPPWRLTPRSPDRSRRS